MHSLLPLPLLLPPSQLLIQIAATWCAASSATVRRLHRAMISSNEGGAFCWRIHANLSLLLWAWNADSPDSLPPTFAQRQLKCFHWFAACSITRQKRRHKSTYTFHTQPQRETTLTLFWCLPPKPPLISQSLGYLTFSRRASEFSCLWELGSWGVNKWTSIPRPSSFGSAQKFLLLNGNVFVAHSQIFLQHLFNDEDSLFSPLPPAPLLHSILPTANALGIFLNIFN